MFPEQVDRRLAAILAADVAGYSRIVDADEEQALKTLQLYRGVILSLVEEHHGRIVGTAGDGVLAEFSSAVQAVRSAVAIQRAIHRHNADLDERHRMRFRIGVNLGDVMVHEGDILGAGVNLAARLEQMADPGGILVSGAVWQQIEGKLTFPCTFLGERAARNIDRPVAIYRVEWKQPEMEGTALAVARRTPPLPNKPSIAVLPFTNMSGDAEQEYFSDGISEDIITALSKLRWLFVIARNTSFVYKHRAIDIKQVGRELGVRYVLEGSVRTSGSRVRVTAQLIEAATGAHVWSERYDRELLDAFDLQDELTTSVVGAIEPELLQVERQSAARQSPETMDAWQHYMRGMWRFYQFSAEAHARAEHHMRMAIERDPTFALGHMGMARVLNSRTWFGWSQSPSGDAQAAYAAARRAIEIDERESYAHYILAWTSLLVGRQEAGVQEAQRAIDLTPNFALAWFALGIARLFDGRFDQVSAPFERAMRLSPHEPLIFFFANFLALSEYHQGQFEKAAGTAEMGLAIRPFHSLFRVLAAACGQLGRQEEARAALDEMARVQPDGADRFWPTAYPYADRRHFDHLVEGLRKAGWDG